MNNSNPKEEGRERGEGKEEKEREGGNEGGKEGEERKGQCSLEIGMMGKRQGFRDRCLLFCFTAS